MISLLAFGSYIYQSASAIILIFAVSHILSPAQYTSFSLALAASQLFCVFVFEWLQLAGVRFLAAASGEEAARLRFSLFSAGLLSALVLLLVGGVAGLVGTLETSVVALALAMAVLQGATDLYFMIVRVSDRLATASVLLILRASVLLAGTVTAALLCGTAAATLCGIAAGYGAALLVSLIVHRTSLQRASRHALLTDWRNFCRYGIMAAAASVIHLSVPVTLRLIVIATLGRTSTGAAGFSMAIDLLQRPFSVLVTAIHTVSYPNVVVQFERDVDGEARRATARMLDFILCATIVMLGGLIGLLPDAAHLFVPADLLVDFLNAAPVAAVFYFLHIHLQATLAVVPHLTKSATRLVVVAACQLVLVSAAASIGALLHISVAGQIASAALATALIILFASGPLIRFRAAPRALLIVEATVAAAAIAMLAAAPSASLLWLAGKIAFAGLAVVLVTWRGDLLASARSSN